MSFLLIVHCIGLQNKLNENDNDDVLSNGLKYYVQRLQIAFARGIFVFLHCSSWIEADGFRISFQNINRNHPLKKYYVVVKCDEFNRWRCSLI